MISPLIYILKGSSEEAPKEIFMLLLSASVGKTSEEDNGTFQNEVFGLLLNYLTKDSEEYFGIIQNSYVQNVLQTNNLLRYISENWENSELIKGDKGQRRETKDKLFNLTKVICQTNKDLLNNKEELKKNDLNKTVIEISTATCQDLERSLRGERRIDSTQTIQTIGPASTSTIGPGRIIFTILLLVTIYLIYVNDIQFTDIRDFIRENRRHFGL